ncbi:MAG: hypothetical protein LBT43_05780 [Prevotella sp.]|jgi:mannosyltransferase OCH1-like enzyme|nr:hypothetical protein [Prevotella sp.]
MKIPKVIHQIWGGSKPLPSYFKDFSRTWQEMNSSWKYEFWDDDRIISLVEEKYPKYLQMFKSFPYNMQRWDTVRYFILDQIGGLYADFDSECLMPIDDLLIDKTFCASLEPEEYAIRNGKEVYLSTAIMGSVPHHPFVQLMIENIFKLSFENGLFKANLNDKTMDVVNSTGPLMLTATYEQYQDKCSVHLISRDYIAAYTNDETRAMLYGFESEILERRIEKAYAVHYFFNNWMTGDD